MIPFLLGEFSFCYDFLKAEIDIQNVCKQILNEGENITDGGGEDLLLFLCEVEEILKSVITHPQMIRSIADEQSEVEVVIFEISVVVPYLN